MGKGEQMLIGTVGNMELEKADFDLFKGLRNVRKKLEYVFWIKGLLWCWSAFCLDEL